MFLKCVLLSEGHKYLCFFLVFKVESGGPLATNTSPPTLTGIVSWGPGDCGLIGYPAVYTKISALWDWILYTCKRRNYQWK